MPGSEKITCGTSPFKRQFSVQLLQKVIKPAPIALGQQLVSTNLKTEAPKLCARIMLFWHNSIPRKDQSATSGKSLQAWTSCHFMVALKDAYKRQNGFCHFRSLSYLEIGTKKLASFRKKGMARRHRHLKCLYSFFPNSLEELSRGLLEGSSKWKALRGSQGHPFRNFLGFEVTKKRKKPKNLT